MSNHVEEKKAHRDGASAGRNQVVSTAAPPADGPVAQSLAAREPASNLQLTREQQALLGRLEFIPAHQLKRAPKVPSDVRDAFGQAALAAIRSSNLLGGPARAGEIDDLLNVHQELSHIDSVLGPMARLVSQNLRMANARLSTHVSEVVLTARANKKTRPDLLEGLADAEEWLRSHHSGPREKKAATDAQSGANDKTTAQDTKAAGEQPAPALPPLKNGAGDAKPTEG